MSRSRRHTPIVGMTLAKSEATDKTRYARKRRRLVRMCVAQGREIPGMRQEWFAKDGKQWIDHRRFPKLMRK